MSRRADYARRGFFSAGWELESPRGLPRGERKNPETAMVPMRCIGTSEVVRDSDEIPPYGMNRGPHKTGFVGRG